MLLFPPLHETMAIPMLSMGYASAALAARINHSRRDVFEISLIAPWFFMPGSTAPPRPGISQPSLVKRFN